MNLLLFTLCFGCITVSVQAQQTEKAFLNPNDSSSEMYIAVKPASGKVDSFLFLLDGFSNSPASVLQESGLPKYAASKNMLTIIPILKTGPLYFGSDSGSQASLKQMIELAVSKYHLQNKPLYLGGFSIGGTCVVKYAEMAVQENYPVKPLAVFAVDPPLDWERFYNAAIRQKRITDPAKLNGELAYMIERIRYELGGTPETVLPSYYASSPYSYSDSNQTAVKRLVKTPLLIISEPDIQWWMKERGYDLSYINIFDQAAMIGELQKLGNQQAILRTTTNKGYRNPGNKRHPHSWTIADPVQTIGWLLAQKK